MSAQFNNYENEIDSNNSYEYGRWLAHPIDGEEVVISGLSGNYPNCRNVYEFQENIFNKVDMMSDDDRRWKLYHPEIPQRSGKLYDIQKFDAGYFGVHEHQAHAMDPLCRVFMERAIEAIFDAGFNPKELEDTNTGIFIAACHSETEKFWFFNNDKKNRFPITGCIRSMIANRMSYYLKLKGPSYITDTACSSSLYALEHAYRAIREGLCDAAIVGTTNLCLHPMVTLQFSRLGLLSLDGSCKAFDENVNGYVRSEAAISVFLQKAKNSRRIYSQVVHAKTNCDGQKEQGITYPSGLMQEVLMKEFYRECQIKPTDLTYLEAHGTGTIVGDLQELNAIDNVFCKNRKTPLLLGSVKSNIGHGEPTSGLSSVTKAIIAFETGLIAPNLHYTTPRTGIEAFERGKLKVVTDCTSLPNDKRLIGINNFGFGGGNSHVLLRGNKKEKIYHGHSKDNLPRLVCVSGREENSITLILDDIKNRSLNTEYVNLYHRIFSKETINHLYRGYSIVSKSGELKRSIKNIEFDKKPLYLIVSNFGSHWKEIARDLFCLPLFIASVQRINNILSKFEINIVDTLLNADKNSDFDQILGTMAIQIAIVDLIKILKIELNINFGYGFGELICGYFDHYLSLKETVLTFYKISLKLENSAQNFSYTNENSAYLQTHLSQLEVQLKEILKKPYLNFNKWLTSSKVSNTSNPILNDIAKTVDNRIPENVIILDIGIRAFPGKEFEANKISMLNFEKKGKDNYFMVLLEILGSLYEMGYNFELDKLYPQVQYPVSRATPMISPLIKWNHMHNWFVWSYNIDDKVSTRQNYRINFSMKDEIWQFIADHVIDGQNILPAIGYLNIAWEAFSLIKQMKHTDMNLVIENCKFHRATNLSEDSSFGFHVSVNKGSGNFEIYDGLTAVINGRIYLVKDLAKDSNLPTLDLEELINNDNMHSKDSDLQTKDIYKELRLRGYNYSGAFKKIVSCNSTITKAYVRWEGNWTAFMDNMLQLAILQSDTRNLYVPMNIKRCKIDFQKHLAYAKSFGKKEPNLPVFIYKELNIIRCGGIEIYGIEATSIAKRKSKNEPILERYVFVPNAAKLDLNTLIRVNMQLALENYEGIKIKSVELFSDTSRDDLELLSPIIYNVLSDLPLIIANILVLSNKPLKYPNLTIENRSLLTENDCNFVVGENILQKTLILQHTLHALKENGFILTREALEFRFDEQKFTEISVLTEFRTDNEKILLLRKKMKFKLPLCIKISNENFEWISKLQDAKKNNSNIIIYSENEPISGILGLINCLRREPDGHKIKCMFIQDQAPQFDINNNFYKEQLNKNLVINVYENSKWGTYRYLILNNADEVESEHVYANTHIKGDLSSLKWFEGPLTSKTVLPFEEELIYYSALNFKDIMIATDRLTTDVIGRIQQEYVLGFEFSGHNRNGKRVMGLTMNGALSTLTKADKYFMLEVPDQWSLAEAATVPTVYTTVLYCFFWVHKLKHSETILIHSGTGGIGQAAIHVALHHGCTVYTTVGTEEKRNFLKERFPQLTDKHIGNSRDTSFENVILEQTSGRGVDIVLNSLAEEKLLASVRCLADGGKFFEIGKFDFAKNNPLRLRLLEKNVSFHGVCIDERARSDPWYKQEFNKLFRKALINGYIKPLNKNIFQSNEIEKAFRYMTIGKHIGKVLIEIRKERVERQIYSDNLINKGTPLYHCDSSASYIIVGGLGGFGLELAGWLILRGARNLILSSRKGLSDSYQSYRIRIWKSYGCHVKISTADITIKEGCKLLILEANKLAPVAGIFNLAVVLKDDLFENQNIESFITSFQSKALATQLLDEISRIFCPNLKSFVAFSSVCCGRGNAGQTNYGMSNSVMERICEKRRQDGLPATAIEWGAIADVGVVTQMQKDSNTEIEIGGTFQQKVSNCLEVLDVLLTQDFPVVSSMMVAEKRKISIDNIVDAVANIMGIRDMKTISLHSTLAEMGMDSLFGHEVKQTLEREFKIFLTATDIRGLTFAELFKIQEERNSDELVKTVKISEDFELILRIIGDESASKLPIIEHKTKTAHNSYVPEVIFLPGIEGTASGIETLTNNLQVHALILQFTFINSMSSVNELVLSILPFVENRISKTKPFNIVAYSYGTFIAIEMVSLLEQKGYSPRHLIFIDGSPRMSIEAFRKGLKLQNNSKIEIQLLSKLMTLYFPNETVAKHMEKFAKYKTSQERLEAASKILSQNNNSYSKEYYQTLLTGICNRIEILMNDKSNIPKLKSNISLFKPEQMLIKEVDYDYGLSELFENPVDIRTFKGNHVTILENSKMIEAIENLLKENQI